MPAITPLRPAEQGLLFAPREVDFDPTLSLAFATPTVTGWHSFHYKTPLSPFVLHRLHFRSKLAPFWEVTVQKSVPPCDRKIKSSIINMLQVSHAPFGLYFPIR